MTEICDTSDFTDLLCGTFIPNVYIYRFVHLSTPCVIYVSFSCNLILHSASSPDSTAVAIKMFDNNGAQNGESY